MNRVIHFEIHATKPDELITFYKGIFGWEFQKWGEMPYWMVTTGKEGTPGINGGLIQRHGEAATGPVPVISYVCTVEVDSVDTYAEKVTKAGGTIAVPKVAIPGVGWLTYCKDPDGNLFGLMQNDPTATL